jgi:ribose 5-phosphate isomerase A
MPARDAKDRARLKHDAAERALAEIGDGMVLGLGSGSTVAIFLKLLAARVASGLRVTGIPSSRQTAASARRLGIPLTDFAAHRRIDLTIDGADQIEAGSLNLVKGLGGALLREKIIASACDRMVVIADETKLVALLGGQTPLPVEIARFGWPVTIDRLAAIGAAPRLRLKGEAPFVTDNGNHIADCAFDAISPRLESELKTIVGVVETGLFIGLADTVILGGADGIKLLKPENPAGPRSTGS